LPKQLGKKAFAEERGYKRREPCRIPAGDPSGGQFASCEGMSPATYGGKDKGWRLAGGKPLPEHLPQNIPPAWQNVQVADEPDADLLVKGQDAKGRTQSVYSDAHWAKAAALKFARVNELRAKDAEIGAEIKEDMKSPDPATREAAAALALIRHTGIRPGGEGDTGAEKQAYGATTLEGRHVKAADGDVRLEFVGKKGVDLSIPVTDASVARDVVKRAKAAGKDGRLFDTSDSALRTYTAGKDGGGFKPKDFRTARGTSEAVAIMKKIAKPKTEKEYKQAVKAVAKAVSERLGNTPTIALQSYIDPAVFAKWRLK
jgi:DNA topoisomerase-1